jgi:hypothetical protein
MSKHELAADPKWQTRSLDEKKAAIDSFVRSFALALPWATEEDFARHGIELVRPRSREDSDFEVTCATCGATIVLPHLSELVQCTYCTASFRVRLEGLDALRSDPNALMLEGRARVQSMFPDLTAGSDRERALVFAHALKLGAPPPADVQAKLAAELGLGAPRTCPSCRAAIALAPKSPLECPICDAPVPPA